MIIGCCKDGGNIPGQLKETVHEGVEKEHINNIKPWERKNKVVKKLGCVGEKKNGVSLERKITGRFSHIHEVFFSFLFFSETFKEATLPEDLNFAEMGTKSVR